MSEEEMSDELLTNEDVIHLENILKKVKKRKREEDETERIKVLWRKKYFNATKNQIECTICNSLMCADCEDKCKDCEETICEKCRGYCQFNTGDKKCYRLTCSQCSGTDDYFLIRCTEHKEN